jgi:Peroxidase
MASNRCLLTILLGVTTHWALLSLCFGTSPNGVYLYPQFYDHKCPQAQAIVKSIVAKAYAKDPRMAASLLRLHFHDCFVKVTMYLCFTIHIF